MTLAPQMRRLAWIEFTAMWIPFAPMFVGMIGLPEGSYAWVERPALTRSSLLVGGVLA